MAAEPDVAWAALEEVGKVNQLIGFLGPVTMDGDVRRVDMAENGIIEELIVSVDAPCAVCPTACAKAPGR